MNAPVIITKRRGLTRKQRVDIFDRAGGRCHICGRIIAAGELWHAEHIIPHAMGGSDSPDDLRPAHVECHAGKTRDDRAAIAKAVRVRAKDIGVVKRPKGRPMPGTRASGWKHKIGGGWEKRNG